MNKKNTKQALLTSTVSLLLCISMLVGTTFAWFTDSVTSGMNQIVAGNLDVEVYYGNPEDENKIDGVETLFNDVTLWEPGAVAYENITVANVGTLDLKYQMQVNFGNENTVNGHGLSEILKVAVVDKIETDDRDALIESIDDGEWLPMKSFALSSNLADGESETYGIVIWWEPSPEDNDWNVNNGKTTSDGEDYLHIDLGIKVVATQYTSETDSFDDQYDAAAPWTGEADTSWYKEGETTFTLTTAADLAGLAELVNSGKDTFSGKTVSLGADIDLANVPWTPIGIDGNGWNSKFDGTFIGTGYTIYNLNVTGTSGVGLFGYVGDSAHIEGVTIDGAYVSGNDYVGAVLGTGYLAANCLINNTVKNATVIATPYLLEDGTFDGGAKAGAVAGYAINGNVTGNKAINCTVIAYRDLGGIVGMVSGENYAVTVSNNTVENVTLSYVGIMGAYADGKMNENMGDFAGRTNNATVENNQGTCEILKESGAVVIYNVEDLYSFAASVNAGKTYKDQIVVLGADIDLEDKAWTPIGNSTTSFQGIFDGQEHVISNLNVNMPGKSNVGLFGMTTNGEVKNLTVENAKIVGRLNVGVVAGTPYTTDYSNITVKGHVEVDGMSYVGGVGGKNAYANWNNVTVDVDETSYVKANSVENGTAYRTYVGGVIGFMGEGTHTVSNVTSNIDVTGSTCDVGGIVGIAHEGNSFSNITCTGNVTITDAADAGDAEEIGGIAGVWMNSGRNVTFIDCSFTGTLSVNLDEGVDLSDNTIVGKGYRATTSNELVILNYYTEDGIEYVKNGVTGDDVLYLIPANYTETTVNVKEGVTTIGNYAFAYNSNVETVVLSSTVRDLGRGFDSSTVKKVVLNEGLEIISSRAFRSTTALEEVVIPSTVTEIADNAFQKSGIKEIVIPANVKTIGETAFGASLIEKVTFEGDIAIQGYAFRGCTKLHTVVMNGYDVTFVKSTLNGRNSMWFCNGESNNPNTSDIDFYVKNEVIKERVLTAMGAERNNTDVYCEQTTISDSDGNALYYTDANGTAYAYDSTGLVAALEDNCDVVLCDDTKIDPAEMSNAYGTTGINVKNGQTIDGCGNTLDIKGAGGTWDSGINTTGGLIKNITVTGSFRGIFINHNSEHSEKVVLENVIIDGTVYTISCDQASNQGLEATNSTFNGWTSYAATLGNVKFTDCNFGEGSGYAFCRPYAPTEFVNCEFEAGFEMDPRAAVTFENCTLNGVSLTAENLAELVTSNIANATVK